MLWFVEKRFGDILGYRSTFVPWLPLISFFGQPCHKWQKEEAVELDLRWLRLCLTCEKYARSISIYFYLFLASLAVALQVGRPRLSLAPPLWIGAPSQVQLQLPVLRPPPPWWNGCVSATRGQDSPNLISQVESSRIKSNQSRGSWCEHHNLEKWNVPSPSNPHRKMTLFANETRVGGTYFPTLWPWEEG